MGQRGDGHATVRGHAHRRDADQAQYTASYAYDTLGRLTSGPLGAYGYDPNHFARGKRYRLGGVHGRL